MRNLDFKYLAAKNYVCFGEEGIELRLTSYGNIVLIDGLNLDNVDRDAEDSRNGVGKSTVPDIMVYTLFGKPLKSKLTHKHVINSHYKRKLRTEVRWGDFRVVRTRKPDTLRMWESKDGWDKLGDEEWEKKHEISRGGMPATQVLIEDKLGLNYVTFSNVVVFTDDNAQSFLECKTETKRDIVENLLSLDKYRQYGVSAKDLCKVVKDKIKDISKEYDRLLIEQDVCNSRVEKIGKQETDWRNEREKELRALVFNVKKKREALEASDVGAALSRYNEAQDKINEINELIPDLEARKARVDSLIVEAEKKLNQARETKHKFVLEGQGHKDDIKKSEIAIKEFQVKLTSLKEKQETRCHECYGVVKEENYQTYSKMANNKIDHYQGVITKKRRLLTKATEKISEATVLVEKYEDGISTAQQRSVDTSYEISQHKSVVAELKQIKEPQVGADERILEDQLEELKKQAVKKKLEFEGSSPYQEILNDAELEVINKAKEVSVKKKQLKLAEDELPYYEFWVKAFGDKGIRKFVIDGVIPALNARMAYWLQFLIDGKIDLVFDNELEETIERNPADGDPFVYHQMSRGEKRRLNLAVSQAFAHVMMLNSGTIPSCVFLDEVTTNIDPVGVVGVYNMILELAKDRQVFVTTHNQGLLDLLEGCERIHLERKNGFTKLVS